MKIWEIGSMPMSGIKLILAALMAGGLFYVFYPQIENFFIFYPQSHFDTLPSDWHLSHEEVYFETEDGRKLHGWFFPLNGDVPVVLFCHGNAGNISHRLENIRFLLDQDMEVFIFDYRGYGKSGGKPSEAGLYRDGLAAYDFLVNQKRIPPHNIVLFGRSLGAAVAIEIALKRRARSLIMESAFTSTKGMARTMLLFRPFAFLLPPHYNNLEKISRISIPKLMVHGEDDDIVPFSMGQRLHTAARPPAYFYPIQRAGHNDTYLVGGKTYFETLAGFVRDSKI